MYTERPATKKFSSSLLDPLLQVLNEIIPSRRPLVVGVYACADHEVGCLPVAHLRMKSLAKISNGVTPTEAGQSTVYHHQHCAQNPVHVSTGSKVALNTQAEMVYDVH